jgi:hypothetical protein
MYVFGELKCVVKEVCADRLQTSLGKPWPRGAQFFKSPTWLIPPCNCVLAGGTRFMAVGGYTETD